MTVHPVPNYAAGAFVDGRIVTEVVATCGLPCGWRGVSDRTTMT
ncbi:hypothetical protein [Nocardia sp. NPDC051833]